MNEIVYPMTFDYVGSWGRWEIVRELVSNAKDTHTPWTMEISNNNLIIKDEGEGLAIRHLLIGKSQKIGDAIGQFGEGLKLALLVATRLGLDVVIESGDYTIYNGKGEIEGEEVFKLSWVKNELPRKGTTVTILDWGDEDFSMRFLEEGDDRIFSTSTSGSIIDDSALFTKGVYICDLKDYAFGYNIVGLDMNRDRAAVSEWNVQCAVGRIWRENKSSYAWRILFQKIAAGGCMEKSMYFSSITPEVAEAISTGFKAAFGDNAVIKTSDDFEREAKHRGAKVIDSRVFGSYLADILKVCVETDEKYIIRKGGVKPKKVKTESLTPEQKKILAKLRRMGSKVGFTGAVEFAELNCGGHADYATNTIRIHITHADNVYEACAIMIHELAHMVFRTEDMTEAHVEACCRIGVMLM